MKVLITANSFASCDDAPARRLEEAGFEITRNPYGRLLTEDELIELCHDKDAVILSTDSFTKRVIENCPGLKVVSRYGVGVDNVDREALRRAGIPLEITKNANSDSVADHAIGLMLALTHHISVCSELYRKGEFKKLRGRDLAGSTVGIIGLGAVGKRVAERVVGGFGCRVLANDVFYDETFIDRYEIITTDVDTIFRESDYVSLHLPSLSEYKGFVNREKLQLMKPDAVLINTARSELVDKDALLSALKEGRLGGYGADVSYREPYVDREFCAFDNVVITPHNAAVTVEAINKMSMISVDNVLKYF